MKRPLLFSALVLLMLGCSSAGAQSPLDQILGKITGKSSTLSQDKIGAGLKQALQISTGKAVAQTGRPDGFLKNEAIKILLPDKLRTADRTLRMVGMSSQLDQLEIGMNRAAEQATPQAKQIFLNALAQMTIDDARRILSGGDTAATEYFRQKSSTDLAAAFTPIVHQSLENVGVVQQYNRVRRNPLAASALQRFDLDNYVVGKTLDGLFYVLGQEETQIRHNPAAQTTALLRQVFGGKK
ncbi:MAG TPA: DUF4197 domain-containing protein [Terriglobales bacterium]|nr:DUF4197 domain-containing protein [Terriglobales bacterium]